MPASFLSALLGLMIMVHTSALPVPLAFLFVAADADAFTEGCETETCCTSLCYVDADGVHHCVHKHGESCDCEFSAESNDADMDWTLNSTPVTPPETEQFCPILVPEGRISQTPRLAASFEPPTPSPPPK